MAGLRGRGYLVDARLPLWRALSRNDLYSVSVASTCRLVCASHHHRRVWNGPTWCGGGRQSTYILRDGLPVHTTRCHELSLWLHALWRRLASVPTPI